MLGPGYFTLICEMTNGHCGRKRNASFIGSSAESSLGRGFRDLSAPLPERDWKPRSAAKGDLVCCPSGWIPKKV